MGILIFQIKLKDLFIGIPQNQPFFERNSLEFSLTLINFLGHPNIKLFITQGGLQSTEESIMYGVPMLIMPFFGDQPYNAKRLEYKKVGRIVFHQSLKKENLKEQIMEVINNPM